MKHIALLPFILIIVNCPWSIVHGENIADVFTTMPDSILPLLTDKGRRDMVDFYNNKMEAKVRNRFGDYAQLDTLGEQYLRLTLTKVSTMEMRLLETSDSTTLVCLIQTVAAPARESRVQFYDTTWKLQHWVDLPVPATADFFDGQEDSLQLVQRSIDDLRLVEVTASPTEPVLTFTLAIQELNKEEKKLAAQHLHALRYRWTGTEFVRE